MLYTIVTLSLYTVPASELLTFTLSSMVNLLIDTLHSILRAPCIRDHGAKMAPSSRDLPDRHRRICF